MGVAGGLVPSPSALIILLSAIGLGRTWFGILLVVAYGVGMAGTLTAAGVLLVTVRDRYQRRAAGRPSRAGSWARRWGRVAPYCTRRWCWSSASASRSAAWARSDHDTDPRHDHDTPTTRTRRARDAHTERDRRHRHRPEIVR